MQGATRTAARTRAKATEPKQAEWLRASFALSLIPPAPDKWLSIDITARMKRVTLSAPRPVMVAIGLAIASGHPLAWQAVEWVRRILVGQ